MRHPKKLHYTLALEDATIRSRMVALCRERSSALSVIAVGVTLCLYGGGLVFITRGGALLPLLGTSLLSVSMITAWYLSHECAHFLVFRRKKHNDFLGEMLSWLNGVTYFRFQQYRRDHIRHHAEQIDLIGTDVKTLLRELPTPLGRLLIFLEGCYVPVMHYVIKAHGIRGILRGSDKAARARVVLVTLAQGVFFVWLVSMSWAAPLWYFLAAAVRIHCVRFVDAFQHSYPQVDPALQTSSQGRTYEEENTFSFPVAHRFKWLNVLILNFGFHTAHHAMPGCAWYNLPRLNDIVMAYHGIEARAAYGAPVRFLKLVHAYHKDLKRRITATDEGIAYDADNNFSIRKFTGAFTDKLLG